MKKILIIAAGFGVKVLVMVYGLQFYKIGRQYNPIENGLYAATSRWLYVIFEASIAITGFTSGLGLVHLLTLINYKIISFSHCFALY